MLSISAKYQYQFQTRHHLKYQERGQTSALVLGFMDSHRQGSNARYVWLDQRYCIS